VNASHTALPSVSSGFVVVVILLHSFHSCTHIIEEHASTHWRMQQPVPKGWIWLQLDTVLRTVFLTDSYQL